MAQAAMRSPSALKLPEGMRIDAPIEAGFEQILTADALAFVAELARQFTDRRQALLKARAERQAVLDQGALLDFLPETKAIREGDWKVAPVPKDLLDRRVEITGPVERKMIINALNSGAKVFMADFEDSLTPLWSQVIQGQINVRDATNRTIRYDSPEGKHYTLNAQTAVLIVRPRGWHLDEKHVTVDGHVLPGALLDFGLYFFHNAQALMARGSGPYFYLPKLEHYTEAVLWSDVFAYAENRLGISHGTIKATVLIETINAAFQMHEILHALKDYCVGLNCGRWDYIYSFIKKFNTRSDFVLPDRAQVTMTTHFLRSYSLLLIQTCHRRGAFAMGGMSAFIPIKHDAEANDKAIAMVRADKEREAGDGHDGTWVAHPGLVPVAMEVFDRLMKDQNQLGKIPETQVTATDLLKIPEGNITEAGLRNNISVSMQYIAAWLGGLGCVPINNLMEDAATAEIARSQIWQWIHHHGTLEDGRKITLDLYRAFLAEEQNKIRDAGSPFAATLERASTLLTELVSSSSFVEFLTIPGYRLIA